MTKIGKNKGSKAAEVSGADTVSFDKDAFSTAKERKDWGKSQGGLLPRGDYPGEVVKATRTVTKPGGPTAGSPMFTLQVRITEGDQKGRVGFPRGIAHPSTGGRYLALLEAMGYDLDALDQGAIPVPKADKEGNVKEWVGKKVTLHVTVKKDGRAKIDPTTKLPVTDKNGDPITEDSNEFAVSPASGSDSTEKKEKKASKIAR